MAIDAGGPSSLAAIHPGRSPLQAARDAGAPPRRLAELGLGAERAQGRVPARRSAIGSSRRPAAAPIAAASELGLARVDRPIAADRHGPRAEPAGDRRPGLASGRASAGQGAGPAIGERFLGAAGGEGRSLERRQVSRRSALTISAPA